MADHALVIGIDAYDETHWPGEELDNAVADALAFATWLAGPGGVPAGSIRLAIAPTASSPPLPPELTDAVLLGVPAYNLLQDEIAAFPDTLGNAAIDRLWLHFAGHGVALRIV